MYGIYTSLCTFSVGGNKLKVRLTFCQYEIHYRCHGNFHCYVVDANDHWVYVNGHGMKTGIYQSDLMADICQPRLSWAGKHFSNTHNMSFPLTLSEQNNCIFHFLEVYIRFQLTKFAMVHPCRHVEKFRSAFLLHN